MQAPAEWINGVIVPIQPEIPEQLIGVREAKLIDYPRLGSFSNIVAYGFILKSMLILCFLRSTAG
jgi:hypothetical protein